MSNVVKDLVDKGLITPPKWLSGNVHYLTIMGSMAYGVSNDSSDYDVYGFTIPPLDDIFPHRAGHIVGFGKAYQPFTQYQKHHIRDESARGGKGRDYDLTIYSIVKYFSLCMENNPNMTDSLYTPRTCVLHSTKVGSMVRDNRDMFLHKGSWHKFKGYAYSQLNKMTVKNPEGLDAILEFEEEHGVDRDITLDDVETELAIRKDTPPETRLAKLSVDELHQYKMLMEKASKRAMDVKAHGFDCKFAYHIVRLMDEIEQILEHGTIDLMRAREQLKAIRRGEWTQDQIREYFNQKEADLEKLYHSSKLRHGPDTKSIRTLLLACLEEHYGKLENCVVDQDAAVEALRQIRDTADTGLKMSGHE